jgi:hypothetical protein
MSQLWVIGESTKLNAVLIMRILDHKPGNTLSGVGIRRSVGVKVRVLEFEPTSNGKDG